MPEANKGTGSRNIEIIIIKLFDGFQPINHMSSSAVRYSTIFNGARVITAEAEGRVDLAFDIPVGRSRELRGKLPPNGNRNGF